MAADLVRVDVDADIEVPRPEVHVRRPGRRGWTWAVVALAMFALYVVAVPVVTRLSFMPRPGPDRVWWDDCNGRPGNRHEQRWVKDGQLWVRTEFATLGGCIED